MRSAIMRISKRGITAFVLFAVTAGFSLSAWADTEVDEVSGPGYTDTYPGKPVDNNGGPNASGYTGKSYHDSSSHIYKHPRQPSYTSPFDYGSRATATPAAIRQGKCNCFTFDATKSYDADGQKFSVVWDFGDGTTSDQPVVQHCYDKAGMYNVGLTVKDSSGLVCDTGVTSTKVDANFPVQANAGQEKQACLGESVVFDGSASSSSGSATYAWDFGDGETGEGSITSHSYKQAGQYRVRLTVDDGKNTACSVGVATTTARIFQNASVTLRGLETACVGRVVTFDAEGTGGKYHWDFGDGETWEGGSRASHAYNKVGTHTVSVTVDDGRGTTCSTASTAIKIRISEPPVAKIGDITSCLINEAINFDGSQSSSSTGNLKYRWNFGDGETGEGVNVTHAYKKSGNYRVTLTVSDDQGGDCSAASDSATVQVNTLPEAVIEVR